MNALITDQTKAVQAFQSFDEKGTLTDWVDNPTAFIHSHREKLREPVGYDYAVYLDYSLEALHRVANELFDCLAEKGFVPFVRTEYRREPMQLNAYISMANQSIRKLKKQIPIQSDIWGWVVEKNDVPVSRLAEEKVVPKPTFWSSMLTLSPDHNSELNPIYPLKEEFELQSKERQVPIAKVSYEYEFVALVGHANSRSFKEMRVIRGIKTMGNPLPDRVWTIPLSGVLRTPNKIELTMERLRAGRIRRLVPEFRGNAKNVLEQWTLTGVLPPRRSRENAIGMPVMA